MERRRRCLKKSLDVTMAPGFFCFVTYRSRHLPSPPAYSIPCMLTMYHASCTKSSGLSACNKLCSSCDVKSDHSQKVGSPGSECLPLCCVWHAYFSNIDHTEFFSHFIGPVVEEHLKPLLLPFTYPEAEEEAGCSGTPALNDTECSYETAVWAKRGVKPLV